MAETTDVAETTESTSEEQTFKSFIGDDGTLIDGWRERLPEDIRNEKIFDRTKNLEGVFKSLASAERKFGMKSVAIPTEKSTDEEWNGFYKSVGMLEKAEDYKFAKDADIDEIYWPSEITPIMQKAHLQARVNPKQAAVYERAFNDFLKQQIEKNTVEQKLEYDRLMDDLKTEWSGSFDANLHIGSIALKKGTEGNPELQKRINDKFGSDPDFARLMKNLGVNFTEGNITIPDSGTPVTTDQIDNQMNELRNSDAYKNKMNPGHATALKRMSELYEARAKIR